MTGMETVADCLAAWAWRQARRTGGRVGGGVDPAVDTALDRLHEAVVVKLGIDPALSRLQEEAVASVDLGMVQVRASTISWAAAVLEGAAQADLGFAAHVWSLVAAVHAAEDASGDRIVHATAVTASGQGAIAMGGDNPGIISTGNEATNLQRFAKTYFVPFIKIVTTHAPAAVLATSSLVFSIAIAAHALVGDQQPSANLHQGSVSIKPHDGSSAGGDSRGNPAPKPVVTTRSTTTKTNPTKKLGPISLSTAAPPEKPPYSSPPNVKKTTSSTRPTTPPPAPVPDLSGAYELDYTPENYGNEGVVIYYWTTLQKATDPQCAEYKFDPCYVGEWYSNPEQTQPDGGLTWMTITRSAAGRGFIFAGDDDNHSLNPPYTDQVPQVYSGKLKSANPLQFTGIVRQEQYYADFLLTRLS